MRKISIFTALFYSFFSRVLYVNVGREWGAKVFGYLLVVLCLSWIPFILSLHLGWSKFLRDDAPFIIQQIPAITVTDGLVATNVMQPHYVKTAESDEVIAVIDTTGKVTSLDGMAAGLLLTDSQLIMKKNENETRVYNLGNIQQFYLDSAVAEKWLRLFGTWGLVLLYPVVVVGSYGYRVLLALFYSLFGLMIAQAERCGLSYWGVLKVTIVALTPAIALKTILGFFELSFPFAWLVYYFVAIGYLAFGLSCNPRSQGSNGGVTPGESTA